MQANEQQAKALAANLGRPKPYIDLAWQMLRCDELPEGFDRCAVISAAEHGIAFAAAVLQTFVNADLDLIVGPQTIGRARDFAAYGPLALTKRWGVLATQMWNGSGYLSAEELQAAMPRASPEKVSLYAPEISRAAAIFGFETDARMAHFLGQIAVETGQLGSVEESFAYSPERACQVWPSLFNSVEHAAMYCRDPRTLANYVYAGRMGNGPPMSGDGWRYRGKGLIQITGFDNHKAVIEALGLSGPEALLTPQGAALSAGWYWCRRGLNRLADAGDVSEITRRIQGGQLHLAERTTFTGLALRALS